MNVTSEQMSKWRLIHGLHENGHLNVCGRIVGSPGVQCMAPNCTKLHGNGAFPMNCAIPTFTYCAMHAREQFRAKKWDCDMCACINTVCDAIGMTLSDRKYINANNIERLLGVKAPREMRVFGHGRTDRVPHNMQLSLENTCSRYILSKVGPPAVLRTVNVSADAADLAEWRRQFNVTTSGHLSTCTRVRVDKEESLMCMTPECRMPYSNYLMKTNCAVQGKYVYCCKCSMEQMKTKGWDRDLCVCLNMICDDAEIRNREEINEHNLKSIFGITPSVAACQLSARRMLRTGRVLPLPPPNVTRELRLRFHLHVFDKLVQSTDSDTIVVDGFTMRSAPREIDLNSA